MYYSEAEDHREEYYTMKMEEKGLYCDYDENDEEAPEDEDEAPKSKVTVKIVTARKARPAYSGWLGVWAEIKVGDRVKVTSWFEYKKGGPRIGYYHEYRRVAKGPGWRN